MKNLRVVIPVTCFFTSLLFVFCEPKNPSGPNPPAMLSMTGNWIPSITNQKLFTVSGDLLADTTIDLYEFNKKWFNMKYVKIDSNLVTIYTINQASDPWQVLIDTTHYEGGEERDSIEIVSHFHSFVDTSESEYIIRENGVLFITAELILSEIPGYKVTYKTRLVKYDDPLPDPTWPDNIFYLSKSRLNKPVFLPLPVF